MIALGLMSGTSADGIDAALIQTDGDTQCRVLDHGGVPYPDELSKKIKSHFGKPGDPKDLQDLSDAITRFHAEYVQQFIGKTEHRPDIIGFHGQTVFHDPDNGQTVQLGDGKSLSSVTGIDVVNDFRSADIQAGGQGAPFLPLYHRALVLRDGVDLPVIILNLGGVANVTWIGQGGIEDILAFDTGPANALLDDWMINKTGASYDENRRIARKGTVHETRLSNWLQDDYFQKTPPKSLDRQNWKDCDVSDLSVEDGSATLTEFTARSVAQEAAHFPRPPLKWYATGGGRKNSFLMERLTACLRPAHLSDVEELGWNGDTLEAEGFAYLAVRSVKNLPLSVPGTTGVSRPINGGVLWKAP